MAPAFPDRLRTWVPRWWRGDAGPAGAALDGLLLPAELGYRAVVRARNAAYDRAWLRAAAPPIAVVSVGNIGVGGAGKTPFAAWVAGRLAEWGMRPAVVLRGYGADEILVHRELNPDVPVFAARRRLEAVQRAAEAGSRVAVLDDAFQHRSLRRHLDLVLVSVDGWGARQRLLPRGPWREGLPSLRRADVVVLTRKAAPEAEVERVAEAVARAAPDVPRVHCRIAPAGLAPLHPAAPVDPDLSGREVLAVASLADPLAFVRNLQSMGASVELAAFPDHHDFDVEEARALVERAARRPLVMTRKEAVKLRPLLPATAAALVLDQRVVVERGAGLLEERLRLLGEA